MDSFYSKEEKESNYPKCCVEFCKKEGHTFVSIPTGTPGPFCREHALAFIRKLRKAMNEAGGQLTSRDGSPRRFLL